jgi:prepilin-type N-terminal cleavage/methylation domain-containing protein
MNTDGFTLVEIMVVVVIIGLLAVIAIPAFQKAQIHSQNTAFINDLRIACGAVEMYTLDHGEYPPDSWHGVMPPEVVEYMTKMDWDDETPIGGQWDWEYGVFGITAGISVRGPRRSASQMQEIDAMFDDGNLVRGVFQRKPGRYTYIIEE